MKMLAKNILSILAFLAIVPAWTLFVVQRLVLGRARACQSISQRASRWPGVGGEFLRRSLMRRVLDRVGRDVVISFGTVISKPTTQLGDGVYIGSYCLLGDVRIGEQTLLGDHVIVPSGAHQHSFDRSDVAIRQQEGQFQTVRIGADCWIGSGAIILADIGDHCVVAAGSVVTKPVADYQIVAGVPAKVIGDRREPKAGTNRCSGEPTVA